MSFSNHGKNWNRAELRAYLKTLKCPSWIKGVTFHHTASPSLALKSWVNGWNPQLVKNMMEGYQAKGWRSGPHFYPDDNSIWGLTPPTETGVHAKSFNHSHIGLEVLGDFDSENHLSGRGARCWANAFDCAAEVLAWAGRQPGPKTINFHRDDPKTNKSCPGDRISKDFVIAGVIAAFGGAPVEDAPRPKLVVISEWLATNGRTEKITKKDNQVMVGTMWIESAFYDKDQQATLADEAELRKDILGE